MAAATAAATAAFRFQPRRGKLDWRSLSSLDLDKVEREVDIDTLERHLPGLAFSNVTKDGACAPRAL
jgi:hypothetical protein